MSSKQIVNCPSCFKCFKKKDCYEKHILYCDRELNSTNIPSNTQLLDMITMLTDKYNNVQRELQNIKNQIYTKNRKIDVLSWLNQSDMGKGNKTTFIDMLHNIDITIDDLQLIFDNNFIVGVSNIIAKYLSDNSDSESIIKCYSEKKNIIYIYHSNVWRLLESDEFIDIMKEINVKLFNTFKQYRDLQLATQDSDQFYIQYNANLKKILCVNIPFDTKCSRIQNKIYEKYKESIKSMTEIEIV